MKSTLTLFLALGVALLEIVFSFYKSSQDNMMDGAWQLVEADYGGGKAKPQLVQLKVFHEGRFEAYVLTPERSAQTMNGKFEVLNDTVYTENLINALNKPMIGKTYAISYKREGDTMITRGSFDVKDNEDKLTRGQYVETWKRVDYPQ